VANFIQAFSKSQNGSTEFYQAMEKHVLANREKFKSQELANIIYSYHKSPDSSKEILKDLESTVLERLPACNP
jgi:hypothetical protein